MESLWRGFVMVLAYGGIQAGLIVIGYLLASATKDDGWLFVAAVCCGVFHYSCGKAVEWQAKMNARKEVKEEYKYSNRPPDKEIPVVEVQPEIRPRASEEMD